MKKLNQIGTSLLIFAVIGCGTGQAQVASLASLQASTIPLSGSNVTAIRKYSDDQLAALMDTLNSTPTVQADTLPYHGIGTFWSLQNPGAPAPADVIGVDVWVLSDGSYLLNDISFDYSGASSLTASANASSAVSLAAADSSNGGTSGYSNYFANSAFSIDTNQLWLQITNLSGGVAYANLFNATNQVYSIWSTPDLSLPFSQWSVEAELFPTNSTTNVFPFMVSASGRTNLFLEAQDWTGVYLNGLPCWWTWYYFHTLDLSWTNQDAQAFTLGFDFTNHYDPNVIIFSIAITNSDVDTPNPILPLNITCGIPGAVAVLANDTHTEDAAWLPYTGSNVMASLGADGNYSVSVGLRGFPTNATETWQTVDLIKSTVAPQLTITSPVGASVTRVPFQVQGFANKPLSSLSLVVSNASGVTSRRSCGMTGLDYNRTLSAYTTNYFQSGDLYLVGGTNIVTLHATDWAGNQTNFTFALVNTAYSNAPVLTIGWLSTNSVISGSNFTLKAQVNDPNASVTATLNGNTTEGLVDGNGTVWVQNLALDYGTNTVSLMASNQAGTAVVSLPVIRNDIGIAVNPLAANQLNQSWVNITGSVNGTNYSVYVNGVLANYLDTNGNWEADSVAVSAARTAEIGVQVYSNSVSSSNNLSIASQVFYQVQPPMVALQSFTAHQKILGPGYSYHDCINWFYQTGGKYVDPDGNALYRLSPLEKGDGYGVGALPTAPDQHIVFNLPWEFAAISVYIPIDYVSYQSFAQSTMTIIPSGQIKTGTTNVYLVMARACEYSNTNIQEGFDGYGLPYLDYWAGYYNNINKYLLHCGDVGLPPKWLQINGQTLVDTGITNVLSSTNGGASISSVWGATVVSGLAGEPVEVTPTATQVYQNQDYTLDEVVSNLTLQIFDANTGTNLSAQTNTVIVGQQMNLTCQLSVTNSFMTNFIVTNFQWTIPGVTISNYIIANDGSSAILLTSLATNTSSTFFCWVDGASNRVVQCAATINGVVIGGKANFNVIRPLPSFTAQVLCAVAADTNYAGDPNIVGYPYLHFGIDFVTNYGISFAITNVPVRSLYNQTNVLTYGNYYITQIINQMTVRKNKLVGTNYIGDELDIAGLDTHVYLNSKILYGTAGTSSRWGDSPAEPLATNVVWKSASESFSSYLMFSPPSGIPVPMYKVNWAWSGSAKLNGTNSYILLSSNVPAPIFAPSDEFPQWTNVVYIVTPNHTNLPPFNEN